jgi:hypothetical protein
MRIPYTNPQLQRFAAALTYVEASTDALWPAYGLTNSERVGAVIFALNGARDRLLDARSIYLRSLAP